ncbi:MAG TPA: hypothetical protein VHR39_16700 [Propionibacteriaceae bacterium]|jgi:hypothetical protein|nr:hypothetical protein [Propionibacteriaceae bacterium]
MSVPAGVLPCSLAATWSECTFNLDDEYQGAVPLALVQCGI